LALNADSPLDSEDRNRLRTLGVSLLTLGQILRENGSAACLVPYHECLEIDRRIGDTQAEAVTEFNLGHAYREISAIRDLDAAEGAYQRSLTLRVSNDASGRSKCIGQIGILHHDRFHDARERKEPAETSLRHARAAEGRYLETLRLLPKDAFTDLAPAHHQLGNLYSDLDQLDDAREHYELAAQCREKTGDRFSAGQTRFNMALMYATASQKQPQPSLKRATLLRAQAYAEAAIRDYHHYQGRAAADEADAQRVLDQIKQDLATLPP
jgi:tetratricopeptide (TPR) repeat protein